LRIRYVREQSLLLDLRILVETVFKLIGVDNITRLNLSPNVAKF
jgi:lipopolysaccharide/colanic/teichoic acid biosynthesis glycosyltransferase